MPPVERRSASVASIFTRTRSLSILIGSFSPSRPSSPVPSLAVVTPPRYCARPMPDDSPSRRHFTIASSDGVTLEAELSSPPAPRLAVVMAHPSPQYGGDMQSNVVSAVFRSGPGMGVAVLRFNFRGVGASSGHHDGGPGERADLRAVVDHCGADFPT